MVRHVTLQCQVCGVGEGTGERGSGGLLQGKSSGPIIEALNDLDLSKNDVILVIYVQH